MRESNGLLIHVENLTKSIWTYFADFRLGIQNIYITYGKVMINGIKKKKGERRDRQNKVKMPENNVK